jgi:holo-[acyl-carrier protein] synthase
MIFAIGHDIVEISRIKVLFDRYGDALLRKILSPQERIIYQQEHKNINYLAKRFAAKEAFAKACNTGLRPPILLPNISVLNDSLGKPEFSFNQEIKHWLAVKNIQHCHLSISDEKNLAAAFVILEQ